MRFGPSLSLTATHALGRPGPADVKTLPAGLLSQAAAGFDDMSYWTLDQDWTAAAGAVQKTGGTTARFVTGAATAIPSGQIWVGYTVRDATAGTVGVQMQAPFVNAPFTNRVTAQHVARFSGTGFGNLRLIGNLDYNGRVEDVQAVDMTALLAQPSDVYIAAGQSLIAAESKSTPVDPALDYWVPRCLYRPGLTNSTYGTVAGQVAACVPPLQMLQVSQGVSPAASFARAVEKKTPPGRTVLIVACAKASTRLIGADAEWNPDGNTGVGGTLYAGMVAAAQAAVARTPGSVLKGLIWGQGESDRSASFDTQYPPVFTTMVNRLRTDLSAPNLPVVLLGPMPDDLSVHQPMFLQTQERLDQDSGHATAIPKVHYVARPAGYMSSDGTHPEPEGNRIAGRLGAARFIAEGYL